MYWEITPSCRVSKRRGPDKLPCSVLIPSHWHLVLFKDYEGSGTFDEVGYARFDGSKWSFVADTYDDEFKWSGTSLPSAEDMLDKFHNWQR